MKQTVRITIFTMMSLFALILSVHNQKTSYSELKINNIEALTNDEGPDPDCLVCCLLWDDGIGSDHFPPTSMSMPHCGNNELMELEYFGYPPCGDDMHAKYGSTTRTCWNVTIMP